MRTAISSPAESAATPVCTAPSFSTTAKYAADLRLQPAVGGAQPFGLGFYSIFGSARERQREIGDMPFVGVKKPGGVSKRAAGKDLLQPEHAFLHALGGQRGHTALQSVEPVG